MEVGTLEGARITLRAWSADDAAWYAAARASSSTAAFAVEDDDHHLTGTSAVERTGNRAAISYLLAPAGRGRGRGLATAAVLARSGFQPTGRTEHPRPAPSMQRESALSVAG